MVASTQHDETGTGVATMELLTPEEFLERVGVRVPDSVIRNLEAMRRTAKTADAVIEAARAIVDKGTILGMGDLQDALAAHDGARWWETETWCLPITDEIVEDMCTPEEDEEDGPDAGPFSSRGGL